MCATSAAKVSSTILLKMAYPGACPERMKEDLYSQNRMTQRFIYCRNKIGRVNFVYDRGRMGYGRACPSIMYCNCRATPITPIVSTLMEKKPDEHTNLQRLSGDEVGQWACVYRRGGDKFCRNT